MNQQGSTRVIITHMLAVGALLVFGNATTARADYSSTVLSQGPVGYWRLNETTAPTVPQSTAVNLGTLGAAGNGVYTNDVLRGVAGALAGNATNHAAFFNGPLHAGCRVRVPYRPEWNVNGPFSVEFWAKPGQTDAVVYSAASVKIDLNTSERTGWSILQSDSGNRTGNGWLFRLSRAENMQASRDVAVTMPLNTNSWYHIVATFDGTTLKLYVNGSPANSVALQDTYRPIVDATAPMTFGSRSDAASGRGWITYIGTLDEPAFYTATLSPARILAHYQSGTNSLLSTGYRQVVLSDSPAGYWSLDESPDILPVATNSGTLSVAGNGNYIYPVGPGAAGPQPPDYPGFEPDNSCILLDGNSGSVSVPALHLNTNTVTITAWLKPDGAQPGNTALFMNRSGDTVAGMKFDQSQQELSYNWSDNPAALAFRSHLGLPNSQWIFAALIIHPDHTVLATYNGSVFNWKTNFIINSDQYFEFESRIGADIQRFLTFKGSIDEVAVFNRSLSLGEVFSQCASAAGNVAPQIFAGPSVNPELPTAGDPLTLTVDAGGTPGVSYQWRRNGFDISGAHAATYAIPNAQATNNGDYDVVIANLQGSVTGQVVTVTVSSATAPSITEDPQSRTLYPTGLANFKVFAAGGQLSYQWRKDGTNILGATGATYFIDGVTPADTGSYTAFVTNSLGSVTSAPAALAVVVPAAGSFEQTILNDGPESWWRLDDAPGSILMLDAFGRHDGSYSGPVSLGAPGMVAGSANTAAHFEEDSYGQVPFSPALNRETFTIEVWARSSQQGIDLGAFSSFSSISYRNARGIAFAKPETDLWWGFNGDGIDNHDPNAKPYLGNSLDFFVPNRWTHWAATVSGNSISWYLNGEFRLGSFVAAYMKTLSAPMYIGSADPAGAIDFPWSGEIDEVTYYPTALTSAQIKAHYVAALYGTGTRPIFLQEPESQTVIEGNAVTFSAQVEGSVPIYLQWTRSGVPIPGATNNTLTLTNLTFSDQASFVLTATNSVGGSNSVPAALTVVSSPESLNLTNQLVLHLKFDGNLLDSSGRTNDATAVGDITFENGRLGQALHYSTDANHSIFNYATLGVCDDLQFGTDVNFSVSYWIRTPTNALTGDLPFFCNSYYSFTDYGYTFAPSYLQAGWSWSLGSVGVYGGPAINDGQWHHLVHTFDRLGFGTTWMDGQLVDYRGAGGERDLDTGLPTNIGQSGSGQYEESGDSMIDDLGVWRCLLSPVDAQSIYYAAKNSGRSFDQPGPITLRLRKNGSNLELVWQTGTLYQSANPTGPWIPVPAATAPYLKITASPTNTFFRVMP